MGLAWWVGRSFYFLLGWARSGSRHKHCSNSIAQNCIKCTWMGSNLSRPGPDLANCSKMVLKMLWIRCKTILNGPSAGFSFMALLPKKQYYIRWAMKIWISGHWSISTTIENMEWWSSPYRWIRGMWSELLCLTTILPRVHLWRRWFLGIKNYFDFSCRPLIHCLVWHLFFSKKR